MFMEMLNWWRGGARAKDSTRISMTRRNKAEQRNVFERGVKSRELVVQKTMGYLEEGLFPGA